MTDDKSEKDKAARFPHANLRKLILDGFEDCVLTGAWGAIGIEGKPERQSELYFAVRKKQAERRSLQAAAEQLPKPGLKLV